MKKLFFLYVWLNLTRPECFRDKENLVKHIRKRTIQTGRLFFSSSLIKELFKMTTEGHFITMAVTSQVREVYPSAYAQQ